MPMPTSVPTGEIVESTEYNNPDEKEDLLCY